MNAAMANYVTWGHSDVIESMLEGLTFCKLEVLGFFAPRQKKKTMCH